VRFSVLINYLALPIILILLLFFYLATRPSLEQEVTFPESTYRFTFQSHEEEELFVQSLQEQGFLGIISPSSVRISLSDTFRPQRVTLQRLRDLLPEDPRRTPYITFLEQMLLAENQPQVFVPPQSNPLEAVDRMLYIFTSITNLQLDIPEPRPWLEMIIVAVLCLLLFFLGTPISSGWISKILSLIFLIILIQEPGPKLFLMPALLGIWGNFFVGLEQSIKTTARKALWFRFKSKDFISFVWIILSDSWKSFLGKYVRTKKLRGLLLGSIIVIPLTGLGLFLEPQSMLVFFSYWLILSLALVVFGTLLSYKVSRRLHPYFDFIPLYRSGSGKDFLIKGLVLGSVLLYGFLGYVSVEYQAIQKQSLDLQTLEEYAVVHNFYQEWFGFGIDLADLGEGFHLMIDRFYQDSQGFLHSRESVVEFTDWVHQWKPDEYDPAILLRFVESGTNLWVVSVPDLGIYSRRTGVIELVFIGIILAFITIISRFFFCRRQI
jgi:hypothetical protein